jgi:transcriptional regulator with XRE-family HTH domain
LAAHIIKDVEATRPKRTVTLEIGGLPTRLQQALERSGLSQNQFARRIGYDKGEFSKLLRAGPSDPKLGGINANVLIRAAQLGRLRVGFLIAGEPPAEAEPVSAESAEPAQPPRVRRPSSIPVVRTVEARAPSSEPQQERKAHRT